MKGTVNRPPGYSSSLLKHHISQSFEFVYGHTVNLRNTEENEDKKRRQ